MPITPYNTQTQLASRQHVQSSPTIGHHFARTPGLSIAPKSHVHPQLSSNVAGEFALPCPLLLRGLPKVFHAHFAFPSVHT